MSDTRDFGGLAGLVQRACKAAGALSFKAEQLALFLVFLAGVITILKKAGLEIPDYAMYFGVTLGIAALLYEMHSAKAMARAWFNAKPGALVAATVIWTFAFGYSVNNWMGAASESQADKTSVHKAAFLASDNAAKAVSAAEEKVARLKADRMLMKPKNSAAAARATVQTSEASKLWRTTDGCKTTRGKQTRDFCDAYASAVADIALWEQIAKQEITLGDAEADLAEARKTAGSTRVETSASRNDLVILTKYAGMTEEDAQIFNGLGAIITISILLSFGSMRAELDRLGATGRRQRFGFWMSARRWYCRIMYDREPENVTINHIGTLNGITPERIREARDGARMAIA